MSTPNPLQNTGSSSAGGVSKKTFLIAGLKTIVYGLDELNTEHKNVACLWLLHARLQTQESMEPLASTVLKSWNDRVKSRGGEALGLIAASLDQRNHGSRLLEPRANEAWKSGNPTHAQDMFSSYHGTAVDTSQLISYLPAYAFPHNEHIITEHLALGVSLGGHCAWHCLVQEPRIKTGIVIIGCPDYASVMSDRARLSRLKSWTESTPPGADFIGSKDFPPGLVEAVEAYDPAGIFLGPVGRRTQETYEKVPTGEEKARLVPILDETLLGKRILCLSGGADKLVPYAQGEPFMRWLKRRVGPQGWYKEGDIVLEDMVFDGVGHEVSPAMVKEAVRFIEETLESASTTTTKTRPSL